MLQFFLLGLGLGTTAGFSPGPLTALVISETLQRNVRAGMWVAFSPMITDAPIMLLCFLLLKKLTNTPVFLGLLSIVGGFYLMHMGLDNFKAQEIEIPEKQSASFSLKRGIVANVLNPNPYIFWTTIGVPILARAWYEGGVYCDFMFLLGFYVTLFGIKSAMAFAVSYSKDLLSGKGFIIVQRLMGIILFLFALLLWMDALRRFGWLNGIGFHP